MSRFAAHAARRNRRRQLLERAPRVSPTIELQHIRDVRRLILAFHTELRRAVEPQLRQDAPDVTTWHRLAQRAHDAAEAFRRVATETARRLEAFSKAEAVRTLGELASDLSSEVAGFVEAFAADAVLKVRELMLGSLDAAVVGEEQGTTTLANILEGWVSRAVNSASNAITQSTAELNKDRQQEAGIEQYYWISKRDNRVRSAHAALDDGEVYSWDDPPLTANESSSGEPCHPGEDYNCRCKPSPVIGRATGAAQAVEVEEEEAA